jgi:Domain of unknown function (DUF4304)
VTEIAKKICSITILGLGQPLKQAGFVRHSTHFSRQFGDSLQVVNVQSSRWNTSESGRFTINVGIHFSSIAALLCGNDPMRVHPKESWCLLRARVGMLMSDPKDHWWTVTVETDIEEIARELTATCSKHVLPWLEQFKTISGTNWKPRNGIMQHALTEAAASLVLGDRVDAVRCIEAELARIYSEPSYSDVERKEQRSMQLRKWAADQGLVIAEQAKASVAGLEGK